jgi:hypothetical protein
MASTEDKARKARKLANETFGGVSYSATRKLANQNAKAATGKDLKPSEERRAADIMQPRRQNDRDRTAARGSFIERRTAKKAAEKRMNAAVGGGAAPKKQAPKPVAKKAAVKKAAVKVIKKKSK